MKFVESQDIRSWVRDAGSLDPATRSFGRQPIKAHYLETELALPLHLQFAVQNGYDLGQLQSISFHSLCRGAFIPLARMQPGKVAQLFGFAGPPVPDTEGRAELVARLLDRDMGLSLVQKLGCLLGDPFHGRTSTFKRDSLVRLLMSTSLQSRREVLDTLTQVGDIGILFANTRPTLRCDPPLTAAEVLVTLAHLPDARRTLKFELLRSLLARSGKVEAYFITRLILQKADFGFEYEGNLVARVLGESFSTPPEAVAHAIALSDTFHVAKLLADKGAEGLRAVQLQPLVAVRPALASGSTDSVKSYPVWVERKYDGIRLMLHKSTGSRGNMLCAAYTRGRKDWMELAIGLERTIRNLPCRDAIVDGELYGTVVDLNGARPATVYEVYSSLQGQRGARPVNLRYAAFDLLYLNGRDLTGLSLQERRGVLTSVVGPAANFPLPVPIKVAEGQLADDKNDVARLYQHFRSQGYEGVITKDLSGSYALARRDPTWHKRKPEITLDLVLLGGVFAVTTKDKAGMFGSFVIGARGEDGGYIDVGDVAGLDQARDAQIQAEIMQNGLITGKRIERHSASGVRPGVELRPHIVVTVRFEGIVKDGPADELKLRDPKLVAIRSDKHPGEIDGTLDIEQLFVRQRMA